MTIITTKVTIMMLIMMSKITIKVTKIVIIMINMTIMTEKNPRQGSGVKVGQVTNRVLT